MQIIKKSSSGIQSIPLNSILLSQRKVFLSDTITMESANTIIQQLLWQPLSLLEDRNTIA